MFLAAGGDGISLACLFGGLPLHPDRLLAMKVCPIIEASVF